MVSNLIQISNAYGVYNKYDLSSQTYSKLKCLNKNILGERIIVTLKNWLLKI